MCSRKRTKKRRMLKAPVFGETGAKRAAAQAKAKQFWTNVQREEELSRILEK